MSDNAKHEAVTNVVILQAMGIRLTYVAEIADAKGHTPKAEVQRQELSEAKCITWMSAHKVVAYTSLRNLLVALAKLWAEHHAQHRQVCLIASLHGKLPKAPRITCAR